MGSKSRGNYQVNVCFKPCANQGNKEVCDKCFRSSNFTPEKIFTDAYKQPLKDE